MGSGHMSFTALPCYALIGSTTKPVKCDKIPINGVKAPGNCMKSLGNGVKSPENADESQEFPGIPGLTLLVYSVSNTTDQL